MLFGARAKNSALRLSNQRNCKRCEIPMFYSCVEDAAGDQIKTFQCQMCRDVEQFVEKPIR